MNEMSLLVGMKHLLVDSELESPLLLLRLSLEELKAIYNSWILRASLTRNIANIFN